MCSILTTKEEDTDLQGQASSSKSELDSLSNVTQVTVELPDGSLDDERSRSPKSSTLAPPEPTISSPEPERSSCKKSLGEEEESYHRPVKRHRTSPGPAPSAKCSTSGTSSQMVLRSSCKRTKQECRNLGICLQTVVKQSGSFKGPKSSHGKRQQGKKQGQHRSQLKHQEQKRYRHRETRRRTRVVPGPSAESSTSGTAGKPVVGPSCGSPASGRSSCSSHTGPEQIQDLSWLQCQPQTPTTWLRRIWVTNLEPGPSAARPLASGPLCGSSALHSSTPSTTSPLTLSQFQGSLSPLSTCRGTAIQASLGPFHNFPVPENSSQIIFSTSQQSHVLAWQWEQKLRSLQRNREQVGDFHGPDPADESSTLATARALQLLSGTLCSSPVTETIRNNSHPSPEQIQDLPWLQCQPQTLTTRLSTSWGTSQEPGPGAARPLALGLLCGSSAFHSSTPSTTSPLTMSQFQDSPSPLSTSRGTSIQASLGPYHNFPVPANSSQTIFPAPQQSQHGSLASQWEQNLCGL